MEAHPPSPATPNQAPGQEQPLAEAFAETAAHIGTGSFHSEIDKTIADGLAQEVYDNARKQIISPDDCRLAFASLRALVPVKDEKGVRWIAGQALGPGMEKRIASREDSAEVDVAAPDGSWGRLPEPVKKELTHYGSQLVMELTGSCTVACSFCTLADKSPISEKMTFGSAVEVMRYFIDAQAPYVSGRQPERTDSLYWAPIRSTSSGTTALAAGVTRTSQKNTSA